MTHLLTWIAGTVVIWVVLFWGAVLGAKLYSLAAKGIAWLMETTVPVEEEMPDYSTHQQPRARVVQTYEGDSLASGVTRAMILALEYKVVVLVHDCTAVIVFPGDKAEDIAHEWQATRKLQEQLMRCEGRGV